MQRGLSKQQSRYRQKRPRIEGVIRQQRPSYRFGSTFPASELSLRRASRLRRWNVFNEHETVREWGGGRGAVCSDGRSIGSRANVDGLARHEKRLGSPGVGKRLGARRSGGRIAYRGHFVRVLLARGSGQRRQRQTQLGDVLARAGLPALRHGRRHRSRAQTAPAPDAAPDRHSDRRLLDRHDPLVIPHAWRQAFVAAVFGPPAVIQVAEEGLQPFPQGLKPIASQALIVGALRPTPSKTDFFRKLDSPTTDGAL